MATEEEWNRLFRTEATKKEQAGEWKAAAEVWFSLKEFNRAAQCAQRASHFGVAAEALYKAREPGAVVEILPELLDWCWGHKKSVSPEMPLSREISVRKLLEWLRSQGCLERACENATRRLQQSEPLELLGEALKGIDEHERAGDALLLAAQRERELSYRYLRFQRAGECYLASGSCEKALEVALACVREYSGPGPIGLNAGLDLAIRANRLPEFLRQLEPNVASDNSNLGVIERTVHDLVHAAFEEASVQPALQAFQDLMRRVALPACEAYWRRLAELFEGLGRPEEAARVYIAMAGELQGTKSAGASRAQAAATRVVMPKLWDAMETGKVLRWLRPEGARVAVGEIIAEIETDKADSELEASGTGVLELLVKPGTAVPVGDVIAIIAEPEEDIREEIGTETTALGRGVRTEEREPRPAETRRREPSAVCLCGQALRPHWIKCPKCRKAVARSCRCGELLEPEWDECPACGEAVDQ